MKQKNAFPPNFIHSLDSSHMMLTSLHCERVGITYVSVHDCFWTHPSSVEIMGKVIIINSNVYKNCYLNNIIFVFRFVENNLLCYIMNQF